MPSTDDNSWDDLYAELRIEPPKAKPASEPEPAPPPMEEVAFDEEPAAPWADEVPPLAVESGSEDMIVEAAGEGDGEETTEGEGGEQTGPERKRRRRRRRRRKGGPADEAGETTAVGADGGPQQTDGYEDDDQDQEAVAVSAGAVADDSPAGTLRDLIAHWNVPSWDDIISGLYRPER